MQLVSSMGTKAVIDWQSPSSKNGGRAKRLGMIPCSIRIQTSPEPSSTRLL